MSKKLTIIDAIGIIVYIIILFNYQWLIRDVYINATNITYVVSVYICLIVVICASGIWRYFFKEPRTVHRVIGIISYIILGYMMSDTVVNNMNYYLSMLGN